MGWYTYHLKQIFFYVAIYWNNIKTLIAFPLDIVVSLRKLRIILIIKGCTFTFAYSFWITFLENEYNACSLLQCV